MSSETPRGSAFDVEADLKLWPLNTAVSIPAKAKAIFNQRAMVEAHTTLNGWPYDKNNFWVFKDCLVGWVRAIYCDTAKYTHRCLLSGNAGNKRTSGLFPGRDVFKMSWTTNCTVSCVLDIKSTHNAANVWLRCAETKASKATVLRVNCFNVNVFSGSHDSKNFNKMLTSQVTVYFGWGGRVRNIPLSKRAIIGCSPNKSRWLEAR